MDNEVEQLLKAEQEVQQLLKELQALKKQVGGYDTARQSLEEVRESLNGLVEKTSSLAEQTHLATTTLVKIGTPEIISRVESIKLAITEFAVESAKQMKSVKSTAFAGTIISVFSLLVSIAILVKLLMATSH
jgi:DNA repair exonuclease SbcCD ATPase subunit